MKKLSFLAFLLIFQFSFAQNIAFSDPGLKSFLVNAFCVDTVPSGSGSYFPLDFNGDQEIQVSEAEAALYVTVSTFNSNNFVIKSVDDLKFLKNLKQIIIGRNDSLFRVDNLGLGLDSLKVLLFNYGSLQHIDLSNLPPMDAIEFDNVQNLDYLNLRNGSAPSQLIFQNSGNIAFACVDSLSFEYYEVALNMAPGRTPTTNCALSVPKPSAILFFDAFPNPTTGMIHIESENLLDRILVVGTDGKLLKEISAPAGPIDLSPFPRGIYSLIGFSGDAISVKRVVKH